MFLSEQRHLPRCRFALAPLLGLSRLIEPYGRKGDGTAVALDRAARHEMRAVACRGDGKGRVAVGQEFQIRGDAAEAAGLVAQLDADAAPVEPVALGGGLRRPIAVIAAQYSLGRRMTPPVT